MTYKAPKLGELAPSRIDCPETATVCFTPLVSWAIFSIRDMTPIVRCTLAASGNCTFTSK